MFTLDASLLHRFFPAHSSLSVKHPFAGGQILPKFTDCAKKGGVELSIQTGRRCLILVQLEQKTMALLGY